jgi:putative SOS response-associated peptidase YedK
MSLPRRKSALRALPDKSGFPQRSYTWHDIRDLHCPEFAGAYNIAPTDTMDVVRSASGASELASMRWGLIGKAAERIAGKRECAPQIGLDPNFTIHDREDDNMDGVGVIARRGH